MSKRVPTDFDDLFMEDIKQYYDLFTEYTRLVPEDYTRAYNLCIRALALADRWNDLSVSSGKLAKAKGESKTDLSKYIYGKYRQMQHIHEHCRMIWKVGEDEMKITKFRQ